MARKITEDTVVGLRDHLAAQCTAVIHKLSHAIHTELYDFGPELSRMRDRLLDIQIGADVLVYRFELGEYAPPRDDGEHVYTLRDETLIPAEYEHATIAAW